jgi:hypothetical protein
MEKNIKEGRRILAKALRSKVPQERRIARHIKALFENSYSVITLERKLGVKPADSHRGLLLRSRDDILAVFGRNRRVLRRGEMTIATGDFWEKVKELKRISAARRAELNHLRRLQKRESKITAQKMLQKKGRRRK